MAEELVAAGRVSAAPLISVVVPVYNKRAFLRASLDSIVAASKRAGHVQLIFVDHHSTDGSYEILREYGKDADVRRVEDGNISTVRNTGAASASGTYLSFIDCDCVVPLEYFLDLPAVFESSGADAVGCEVGIPESATWSERLWYELHVVPTDGARHYLNSANFAVRRAAFDAVGGFDETLPVGEDTNICQRLTAAGYRIFESHRLSVIHLDNPKTPLQFFRKQRWHGLAVLRGGPAMLRNKATIMMFAHVAALVLALVVLGTPNDMNVTARLLTVVVLLLAAPVVTVAYRYVETRRLTAPAGAIALYELYYCARATALVLALVGREGRWLR
jgi:glycosyltransferase involved in cell wall biosynthesis